MQTTSAHTKRHKHIEHERARRLRFGEYFASLDTSCVAADARLAYSKRDRQSILLNATRIIQDLIAENDQYRTALRLPARETLHSLNEESHYPPSAYSDSEGDAAAAYPNDAYTEFQDPSQKGKARKRIRVSMSSRHIAATRQPQPVKAPSSSTSPGRSSDSSSRTDRESGVSRASDSRSPSVESFCSEPIQDDLPASFGAGPKASPAPAVPSFLSCRETVKQEVIEPIVTPNSNRVQALQYLRDLLGSLSAAPLPVPPVLPTFPLPQSLSTPRSSSKLNDNEGGYPPQALSSVPESSFTQYTTMNSLPVSGWMGQPQFPLPTPPGAQSMTPFSFFVQSTNTSVVTPKMNDMYNRRT